MQNYKLQQDFENCMEHLIGTHYLFLAFLNSLKQELIKPDIQEEEKKKLELNISFTEILVHMLQDTIEATRKISFEEQGSKKAKLENNNLVIFPVVDDKDIFVDMDYNLSDFWKHKD